MAKSGRVWRKVPESGARSVSGFLTETVILLSVAVGRNVNLEMCVLFTAFDVIEITLDFIACVRACVRACARACVCVCV